MILIVGLVLIAIPCAILGWILISASMDTGKPINGDRFKGDLDPAITKDQLSEIESRIKAENQVEKVTVELTTATLRPPPDRAFLFLWRWKSFPWNWLLSCSGKQG